MAFEPLLDGPRLHSALFAPPILLLSSTLLALLCGAGPFPAAAQLPAPSGPGCHDADATEIVLLGVSHFAGSPTDEDSSTAENILSDRRQRERDSVAARIARFGPDQFFHENPDFEVVPAEQVL